MRCAASGARAAWRRSREAIDERARAATCRWWSRSSTRAGGGSPASRRRRLAVPLMPTRSASRGSAATATGRRASGYALRPIGDALAARRAALDDLEAEQRAIERALALAVVLVARARHRRRAGPGALCRAAARRGSPALIEAVAEGDLSRRVAVGARRARRVRPSAARLNAMLDKIERLMAELRVVTDSLAHDLRSPLARLRAKTEQAVLLAEPAQREAALGGLLVETDLVMRMLTTLIEISRSESVSRDRLPPVDPADLIEEIAELYAPVAEDAGWFRRSRSSAARRRCRSTANC